MKLARLLPILCALFGLAATAAGSTYTWTAKTGMPTARTELAAAAIGGKLYAVGGRNGNFTALNTLEVYDPATNAWTAKAGMPTARYALAAAAINGKLYVVGGINSSSTVVKTLEVYDPATNAWTTNPAEATRTSPPSQRITEFLNPRMSSTIGRVSPATSSA